jgi:hypothetical protein
MHRGYLGNALLKRVNTQINWSAEQVQEFMKCADDPIYFTEKYVKIIHVDRGLIGFELYDWQKEMFEAMTEERYSAFVVARQGGKSVAVGAWLLWFILFHQNVSIGLLANKGDTAREILGRIQRSYQHLPGWIQHGVIEWRKGSFELENGSRIIAAATSSDNVRGYTFNIVYLDEVAHVENYEEFFASVFPTISSGMSTKIIQTSTPFGLNHFYKTVELGKRPKDSPEYNGYRIIEVPWNKIPGRNEEWKEKTLMGLNYDYEKFDQEYGIQFMGSSGTLISGWKLKELLFKVPIYENKEGLKQYTRPEPNHHYVIVADTSEGKGQNYSAFQCIDITTMPYDQVCTFRNNLITPMDFASIIHSTARLYNDAHVLPEVTTLGEQVGNALLFDFSYEGLLMTVNQGRFGKKLVAGFGTPKNDKGVRTTKLVKAVGCSMLKLLLEQNQLMINDHATIEELSRFSKKGSSYEAEPGSTDDLTMCLVLFGWMTNQVLFKELSSIHTLDKLREIDEEQIQQDMIPFGFIVDGKDEEEPIPGPNWLWRKVEPDWTW